MKAAGRRTSKLLREDRGPVRILTLSNPSRRNALDLPLLDDLRAALARAAGDGVRCLVLRGEGDKAFCAGMDLDAVHSGPGTAKVLESLERTMQAVEAAPPVVAFLNGVAHGGGCELACACDFRVARSGIELCLPPAKLSLVYSAEGITRVSNVIGLGRTKRMLLTGLPVEAKEALAWGLVDEVLPARRAFPEALALAERVAANAPLSLVGMKRAASLVGKLRLEPRERGEIAWLQKRAFNSHDAREALSAFKERRRPVFKGE